MPRLRVDRFLAGLLIALGLALLPAAAGASWEAAAALAALSLTDALLTTVGLLVAAMTGVASVLVVADVRADAAAARAWQGINAELALVGTVVETGPAIRIDARYAAGPQDEDLRRILLAHRFAVPALSLSDAGSAAVTWADAVASQVIEDIDPDTEHRSIHKLPAADRQRKRKPEAPDAAFDCPPLSIDGNVRDCDTRGQVNAKRRVSRALLVANAGVRWDCSNRFVMDVRRASVDGCTADVIVLANRSSRDGQPAHRDVAPAPATTAQPGCRGPPAGVSQQQVSSGPRAIGKSFREKNQSQASASTDPVVVDNLGDRVPVCAAELQVVETYLDRELGELLAAVASGADFGKS